MVHFALRFLRLWRSLVLVLVCAAPVEAGSLTLAWDPSPDPAVTGYTIGYGTRPRNYTSLVYVANVTSYTIGSLPGGTYYLAVRAHGQGGAVSSFSNEVVATVVVTCTTADPFAALGGGTCYNGAWLPPGMAIPSSPTTAAAAPAPSPAPSTSPQGCTTPDPFAALGGGTCYNRAWLPPGMPIPGTTTSAPAPAPAPTPAPMVAPPPSTQGCRSPDPFATMGGGTCYNGGWLPPGMAVPGGGTAPAPSPAPIPAPVTMQGCATQDPFGSLGGGTCYNGGWLPPGIQVTVTGTLTVLSGEDGTWAIDGDNGVVYTASTALAPAQLVEGASVTLYGLTMPQTTAPDGMVVLQVILLEIHQ